jgi:hypothetical protein
MYVSISAILLKIQGAFFFSFSGIVNPNISPNVAPGAIPKPIWFTIRLKNKAQSGTYWPIQFPQKPVFLQTLSGISLLIIQE